MLSEYQRDWFIDGWHLSEPAETACVRRLITGDGECTCNRSWVDRERETIGERDDPPHKPPHSDHATLWLDDDGNPEVYSMHIYPGKILNHHPSKTADPDQQQRNGWFDIVDWCAEWGLGISISSIVISIHFQSLVVRNRERRNRSMEQIMALITNPYMS